MNNKVKIVILAAGKGKRMQSEHPKVLAKIQGKPMIEHLRSAIMNVHGEKPIAVIGHQAELVKEKLGDSFVYVIQKEQLGTGHALLSAKKELKDAEHIVVLYGDQPFISGITIKNLIEKQKSSGAKITFATTKVPNFENNNKPLWTFARILRDKNKIVGIKEFRDTNDEEKNIQEVNAGCYVFEAKWLWENLEKIKNDNAQKEYYLPDLIKIGKEDRIKIESIEINPQEAMGANSKEELDILEKLAV